MAKAPTTESIAAALTVPERVLLFCLASDTDWVEAGVTHATIRHLLVRNLIERDHGNRFVLISQGDEVLSVLLGHSGLKLAPRN